MIDPIELFKELFEFLYDADEDETVEALRKRAASRED